MPQHTFLINEIFTSIEGETSFSGFPALFIMFTGCNLRCSYCDTKYAYFEGSEYTSEHLKDIIIASPVKNIVITGGEPLIQEGIEDFICDISGYGKNILIETNGSKSIKNIRLSDVYIMLDVKTPSSQMTQYNSMENIPLLREQDELKFTISDKNDFNWAMKFIKSGNLKSKINFSPVFGKLPYEKIAKWITDSGENIRLNLQIHKIIWPKREKGI